MGVYVANVAQKYLPKSEYTRSIKFQQFTLPVRLYVEYITHIEIIKKILAQSVEQFRS